MKLLTEVAWRLRQRDLLQALFGVSILLLFALAVSWPGTGEANVSWPNVAQVRSVALMLVAVGFGVFSAATPERLGTLVALMLLVPLVLPLEALAYAASYPDAPVWWFVLQPLLDTASYFGLGLVLGRATKRVAALWPLLPPLVFVALLGLSVWLEEPLFNPVATSAQLSWPHLGLSLVLALATLAACVRSRVRGDGD